MNELIKPEQITLNDIDGNECKYNISRVPAIESRELITQYPLTALPKVGDYNENQAKMFKLMNYVERVTPEGHGIRLTTPDLINNHVPDGETLIRLEGAMLNYNTNFLKVARISKGLTGFSANIEQLITRIATNLSASFSQKNKQPRKSSRKSTT